MINYDSVLEIVLTVSPINQSINQLINQLWTTHTDQLTSSWRQYWLCDQFINQSVNQLIKNYSRGPFDSITEAMLINQSNLYKLLTQTICLHLGSGIDCLTHQSINKSINQWYTTHADRLTPSWKQCWLCHQTNSTWASWGLPRPHTLCLGGKMDRERGLEGGVWKKR